MKFMRYKFFYFALSLLVIVPSIWSLISFGLKPAIDFTGGALLELSITANEGQEVTETRIREINQEIIELYSVQKTAQGTIILRTKQLSDEDKNKLIERLQQLGEVKEIRYENVGPTIGRELLQRTFTAVLIASVLILLYVAYRFNELKYGVCAILAMFHDTFILLGSFSLLGHFANVEVDILFVTALLTTLSFSVHDTIVVYDRIRESLKRNPKAPYVDIVDLSVTETLGRSLNNSFTIIFMLVALLLFGGITIKWFILALFIGTVSGTYSSTFNAAPLLVVWSELQNRRKQRKG